MKDIGSRYLKQRKIVEAMEDIWRNGRHLKQWKIFQAIKIFQAMENMPSKEQSANVEQAQSRKESVKIWVFATNFDFLNPITFATRFLNSGRSNSLIMNNRLRHKIEKI